jgi:hypothetical protein
MPKKFMRCVRKVKMKSSGNPYAICRKSTGFYGSTNHSKLILTGNKKYINYMAHHLPAEHRKTRGHIKII